MSAACPTALTFSIDDDGRLIAAFDPSAGPVTTIDAQTVIAAIIAAGHGALWRDEPAIERFAGFAGVAREPLRVEIGERRDATCIVTVSDDAMTATLRCVPPFGGAPMTREGIAAALVQAGVVTGVLDDAIDAMLAAGATEPVVVARGRAPQPGTPAEFRSLIARSDSHGPTVDERGIADYRELGTLLTVQAGDPLMRRIPAQPGVAGEDLFGRVIPVADVADPPFSTAIVGASVAADDPGLLRADVSGQPVSIPRGVSVQPVIHVPAVDLQSGNVRVEGAVQVRGDVAAGMRVQASGDVFVLGTVEAAQIECSGNLSIAAGAIGRGDGRTPGRDTVRARLQAVGTVEVRFAESATIVAGSDLLIGEFALHCELAAHERIVIGKPGAPRSQLIGGRARAASLLQVGVLGSTAGVHTEVEIGYEPELHATVAKLQGELAQNAQRLESLQQVIAYTETLTDNVHRELRQRAFASLTVSEQQQVDLLDRLADAEARRVLSANPRIVVGQAAHAGVEIRLGQRTLRLTESTGAGDFVLLDGEIRFQPR